MLRGLAFLILVVLAVSFGLRTAHPVSSAVRGGGGIPDFLLKTYTPGQTANPFEESYEPSAGWAFPIPPLHGRIAQTPAVAEFDGSGSHDLFVLALRSDQQIHEAVYSPSSGWSNWSPLPALPGGAA